VPDHMVNPDVVLDGTPDIVVPRRASIKLADKPQIIVAIPIGCKPVSTVLECPQCLVRHEQGQEEHYRFSVDDGFRAPAMIPAQFMLAHMNWVPPLNVSMAYMVQTGMLSAQARQIMTMEAIRMNAKYIFYVDDDTLIPPKGLYTLHNFMERNPKIGAVSGVYTTREDPPEPLIYREHGAGCAWDFEMGDGATPEPIFGAGAGCLLARVEAIKDWMDDHPGIPIWADERQVPQEGAHGESQHRVMWGHDIRFCKLLNEQNWPVYVDGRVLCGHHDLRTGRTVMIPHDAPGFKKRNINTQTYWDQIYTSEGADSWRKYPEMFQKVSDAVLAGSSVIELGCGVGILGSKLTAERSVKYVGYDISEVAVNMAKSRFLDARVLDVNNITPADLGNDTVVMTELIEHMDRADAVNLLSLINHETSVRRIIITCPDNCMGPEEVPEHTALFNSEYLLELITDAGLQVWSVSIDQADANHLICIVER